MSEFDSLTELRGKAEAALRGLGAEGGPSAEGGAAGPRPVPGLGASLDESALVQELRVHQLELELQNEELRATQRRLEEARDGFARLYNDAPVGYISVDQNGLVIQANRTFMEMARVGGSGLVGSFLAERLASPDREIFLARFKAFFKSPEGKDLEARLAGIEPPLWVRFTGRLERESPFPKRHEREGQRLLLIVTDVTERRLADERVRQLLADKELLLKEVHHRIKNNMSSIAALLELQSATLVDEEARRALGQARERVRGMMLIYNKLFMSEDFIHVDVRDYVTQLVADMCASITMGSGCRFQTEVEEFELDSRTLFPLGIVLNELVTNALKYAYPSGRGGRILVRVGRAGEGRARLLVADEGVGLPGASCATEPRAGGGFGLTLVQALVAQVQGSMACSSPLPPGTIVDPTGPGTAYEIEFPIQKLFA